MERFVFFKLEFSHLMANKGYETYGKLQNLISLSVKICLLGKNTGVWGMDTTIVK